MLSKLYQLNDTLTQNIKKLEFLPLLALRLYLAPIFISAGYNKINTYQSTIEWFGNTEWGLGLPMPVLMVTLAIAAEFLGGIALLFGLGTRLVSIPLMITMLVAAITVHLQNGWFAIAPGNTSTSMAAILEKIGFPGASESLQNSAAVSEKMAAARSILEEHGNYDWLTEAGNFVVLNNGIEFAATYFVMLMVLFIHGAGKVSIDHLITILLPKKV